MSWPQRRTQILLHAVLGLSQRLQAAQLNFDMASTVSSQSCQKDSLMRPMLAIAAVASVFGFGVVRATAARRAGILALMAGTVSATDTAGRTPATAPTGAV